MGSLAEAGGLGVQTGPGGLWDPQGREGTRVGKGAGANQAGREEVVRQLEEGPLDVRDGSFRFGMLMAGESGRRAHLQG